MTGTILETENRRVVYLLVTTPLALLLGLLTGMFFLPWIQAAAVFPLYYHTLTRGTLKHTAYFMAGWAILTVILVGLLSFCEAGYMETRILYGSAYQKEMFHWISTGIGAEGNIRQFLPQHALHFLVFTALTLISGGFLGLVMGSSLLNYMSFYVGTLLVEANSTITVLLMAWPPWAIARVAGFILIAMVLSMLVFRRFHTVGSERQQISFYAILGLSLLLLDVLLKWRLAGIWQVLLQRLTGL